jgi:hypothetical protein
MIVKNHKKSISRSRLCRLMSNTWRNFSTMKLSSYICFYVVAIASCAVNAKLRAIHNSTSARPSRASNSFSSSPAPTVTTITSDYPTSTPTPSSGSVADTPPPGGVPTGTGPPTLAFTPSPSSSSSFEGNTFAPTPSSLGRNTLAPTLTFAPAPTSSVGGISPAPTASLGLSTGAFSLAALRVACESFLCPNNHEMVQYCHASTINDDIESFCVTAQEAFLFLETNDNNFCGPC